MPANSIISRADYEDYLIYLYFGSNADLLTACINRAYLDFNRTLHGFRKSEGDIYESAKNSLLNSLEILRSTARNEISVDVFDNWHEKTCESLISVFSNNGYRLFVGQAQKWVNMTMKYIFTAGEQRIPGFDSVYSYCHVPFDNILLGKLEKYGFPSLNRAWSRLDKYDEYFERQKWVRQRFSLAPMDVEFLLWSGKEISPEYIR
jgi:hypothetical protein